MPMIDVYAAAGTFSDQHALAQKLATELMTIEQVPDIPMFRKNTAAFVHELPSSGLSNVDGDTTYVRVQVLTNAGALDRDKQLAGLLDEPAPGECLPASLTDRGAQAGGTGEVRRHRLNIPAQAIGRSSPVGLGQILEEVDDALVRGPGMAWCFSSVDARYGLN